MKKSLVALVLLLMVGFASSGKAQQWVQQQQLNNFLLYNSPTQNDDLPLKRRRHPRQDRKQLLQQDVAEQRQADAEFDKLLKGLKFGMLIALGTVAVCLGLLALDN